MADSLIDLPGSGLTPTVINPPRIRYPFRYNPVTPDIYARVTERDWKLAAGYYDTNGRLATRTSYTNLVTYSNDFGNAAWTKNAVTITADSVANPWDGQISSDKILETTANDSHYVRGSATLAATPTTLWAVTRGISRDWCSLTITDSAATSKGAAFNTTTGAVGGKSSGATTGIIALGNGWYLIYLTITPAAGAATVFFECETADGPPFAAYAGTATKGFYVAQMEVQSDAIAGPLVITTSATATVSVPDIDYVRNNNLAAANLLDPFGFLVSESDPAQSDALLGQFMNAYARLPAPQLIPSTKFFTRPVLDDVFVSATAWAVSFDPFQKYSWVFTSRKTIGSIGALVLGTTPIAQSYSSLPASNVTFTDSGAHTVTVQFNSGASSIQSSLAAALTSLGAITVSSTGAGLQISWANGTGTMKSIESSSTAITMGGGIAALTVTFEPSQTNTQAPNPNPATRGIVCTGHGGHVGDYVVFWYNDRIIARSKVLIVTDADHFSVMGNDINGADIAPNYCGFSANAAACYVNGSKVCTTRKTTTFYLPGYSVGITTYADIPTQLTYLDSLSWLGRILAVPTGWANIEVSEVTQWMGAILQQEITEIQMDDALDTVTP